MKNAWLLALSLIAVTVPFVGAIIIALQRKARPRDIEDYFLYDRSLPSKDFLKTSVGYSLQAASIYLFIYWALVYGIGAIFVPIAWWAGYVLQRWAVSRGYLDRFLGREGVHTIHRFTGEAADDSSGQKKLGKAARTLVVAMAVSTIIGLGGTLIAEMDYASVFVHDALGLTGARFVTIASHIGVLLFAGLYVLWGGYRAVVETDKFQVPVSYVSFGVVLFVMAALLARGGDLAYGLVIAVLGTVMYAWFWWRRRSIRSLDPTYSIKGDSLVFGPLVLVGFFVVVASVLGGGRQSSGTTLATFLGWQQGYAGFNGLLGFGVLGVLALLVANAGWQFVDISSLQRLQSVQFGGHNGEQRRHVLMGLNQTAVEAAGVWVLILLLGLGLRLAKLPGTETTASFFAALPGAAALLAPVFVFTVITFMLSTVDGFISAISYVAHYDLFSSGEGERGQVEALRYPRMVTLLTMFAVYLLYLLVKEQVHDRISAVLYGVWAFQISIGVVIIRAFFSRKEGRRVNALAGVASVFAGWVGAIWTVFSSTPWFGIPADSWYVIPPLVAAVFSTAVYLAWAGVARLSRAA